MEPNQDEHDFYGMVRRAVYEHFIRETRAPTVADVVQALDSDVAAVRAAYQRLAADRELVLQANGEVLMAEPFSAVPTAFEVEAGHRRWWGNCIWDGLGIVAMLNEDSRINSACPDCGTSMVLTVNDGTLLEESGLIHIAVPAKRWWHDVVFT